MATEPHGDIVQLATASTPAQAHLWQQVLQQEGIQARVVGDYLGAGIGDIPGLRAEVWVHRDDAQRAREILRNARAEHTSSNEPGDKDPDEMSESV